MADQLSSAHPSAMDMPQSEVQQPDRSGGNGHIVSNDNTLLTRRSSILKADSMRFALKAFDLVFALCIALTSLQFAGFQVLSAPFGLVLPFLVVGYAAPLGLRWAEAYQFGYSGSFFSIVSRSIVGASAPVFLTLMMIWPFKITPEPEVLMKASLLIWMALCAVHAISLFIFREMKRTGTLNENIIIVGATGNARRMIERNQEHRELNIVGVFDDRLSRAPTQLSGVPLLGTLDDLLDWDQLPYVDRIVVTVTTDARERVNHLLDKLRALPHQVVLLFDMQGFDPEHDSLAEIANAPGAYVSGAPEDERRAISKRIFDVVMASVMLVCFSPFMLAVAAAIKMDSPGPIFFRQKRHGFNNEIIRVWKFRSMKTNLSAEERMTSQTKKDDPRVTRIGRIIRKTSLDELPQLLNVLRGEMSIVGPRPHAVGMTTDEEEVHAIVSDYAHRHRAKPGITGWAQINGSRGPVHTRAEVQERVRLDMEYVNRSSIWFDLYIMIMTAPCLLGDAKRER